MRLSKRGHSKDYGTHKLVDVNKHENALYISLYSLQWDNENKSVSFQVPGSDGPNQYLYTVELTTEELRLLFQKPLDSQGTTDSEKELWTTFFKLWEKTITKKAKK